MQLSDYGLWVHLYKHSPKFKNIPLHIDRVKSLVLDKSFSLKKEDNFTIEIAYNGFVKTFCHKHLSEIAIKPMYGGRISYLDLKKRQYQNQELLQIILEVIWRNNSQVIKFENTDHLFAEVKMFDLSISKILDTIPEIANED